MMGIFSRIKDITKSNINSALDKAEDPEKMVNQMLRDANKDLAKVKEQTAVVMANRDSARRRLEDCENRMAQYDQAAEKAVLAGNDQDALALIQAKERMGQQLQGLKENFEAADRDARQMREAYDKVSQQVAELESRAAMIKGKAATAKARERASKITSGVGKGTTTSLEAFDRMEAKANQQLDTAAAMDALNQMSNSDDDLLSKYSGGSQTSADQELAAMKARLGR